MRSTIHYVGHVHKETIVIGVAEARRGAPEVLGTIPIAWSALHKNLKRLASRGHQPKKWLSCLRLMCRDRRSGPSARRPAVKDGDSLLRNTEGARESPLHDVAP